MGTIKIFGLGLIGILMMSSCVSSKKYNEAMKESKKYQDMATASDSKIQKMNQTNEDLSLQLATLKSQLDKKQVELSKNKNDMWQERTELVNLEKAIKREEQEIHKIRQKICDALKCFTPDELTIKERNGELYVEMYDKLLFSSGSIAVNERGKDALKMLSGVLKNNNMRIMVEGHTDAVPIHSIRFADNWDLSVIRATNVSRILIKDNISPDRIIASGKSKFDPFDTKAKTKEDKLNRRVDIVLVPKLDELYSMINKDYKLDIEPHNVSDALMHIVY